MYYDRGVDYCLHDQPNVHSMVCNSYPITCIQDDFNITKVDSLVWSAEAVYTHTGNPGLILSADKENKMVVGPSLQTP